MYALFHWWLKAGDGVMEEVITHWGALSTTQLCTTTCTSLVYYYVYRPDLHCIAFCCTLMFT